MKANVTFSIKVLLALTASVAVLLAIGTFIRSSSLLGSTSNLPVLFPLEIVFEVGFGVAPFAAIAGLVALVTVLVKGTPKPATTFVYLIVLCSGLFTQEGEVVRFLAALLLLSMASFAENVIRRPRFWICTPLLCLGITYCCYLTIFAILMSAAC